MNASGFDLIARSIDVALDKRKLALIVAGLAGSVVPPALAVWLGNQLSRGSSVLSLFLLLIGLLLAWAILSIFAGAVARLAHDDLAERPAISAGAALRAALGRMPALMLSPVLLVIGVALVLVLELVVVQVGRIQALGEILVALLFLPLILLNLTLMVVLIGGSWLLIPIIMGEDAGVFQALGRLLQLTRQSPGRILAYLALASVLSVLVTVILALFVGAAYTMTFSLAITGLGDRAMLLALGMPNPTMWLLNPASITLGYSPGFSSFGGISPTMQIAALIISLETILLMLAAVYAAPMAFVLTIGCATHLAVSSGPAASMQSQSFMPSSPPFNAPQYTPPFNAPQYTQTDYTPTAVAPTAVAPTAVAPTAVAPTAVAPTMVSQPRACATCGKVISNPNSRFCPSCGAAQPMP